MSFFTQVLSSETEARRQTSGVFTLREPGGSVRGVIKVREDWWKTRFTGSCLSALPVINYRRGIKAREIVRRLAALPSINK